MKIDMYLISSCSGKKDKGGRALLWEKMYLQCSRFIEGPKMRSDASNLIEKKDINSFLLWYLCHPGNYSNSKEHRNCMEPPAPASAR